jgi:CDP-diglyceride synthetase
MAALAPAAIDKPSRLRQLQNGSVQPFMILKLLILLAMGNGTPVLAKVLLGDRLARPLDGGAVFVDGRPLFGPAKTIRGILVSLVATPLAAWLIGLSWHLGVVLAALAIAGDLLSSFVKRRMGLALSSMAIGLDQIPESLLPLLGAPLFMPLSLLDVLVGMAIFFTCELILSRILFHLNLRDRPY